MVPRGMGYVCTTGAKGHGARMQYAVSHMMYIAICRGRGAHCRAYLRAACHTVLIPCMFFSGQQAVREAREGLA